jgi:ribosomal protein L21E
MAQEEVDPVMKFKTGDRVKVTVDSPPGWPGAWGAAKGEAGVIVDVPGTTYGVLLDNDPDQMPAAYDESELEAES